jgi:16S rRNA (adenine1518-N6/adenine1519-N6)-dimethyltransferase
VAREGQIVSRKERILEKLKELGTEPKRSLGQNFLISDNVVDRILMAARSAPFSDLVEVGPGLGALTDDLLRLGPSLTLIELDRRFAQAWREKAESSPDLGIRVIEGDALRLDWRTLGLRPDSLLVSNLPYQISSSLVIERSLEPAGISRMVLMFQKEVAQRISARAASKEYGLLTVIAQTFWETSTVSEAGPRDFFPPPNVASRVLMFKRRKLEWQEGASGRVSSGGFLKFAKAAFSQRRKLLTRNLQGSYFGEGKDILPRLEAVFAAQGLAPTARAEELDPKAFVRLYLAMAELHSQGT